ncbi:helix-turn-helix transcriptional regulator, partial [bacterium]|nr:helix-turn-helix transcriptional regulator [bacterium]
VNRVDDLLDKFCIERKWLNEKFKIAFLSCPKEYIQKRKIELLENIIKEDGVGEIAFYYAYAIGFKSSPALYNMIKRKTGLAFLEYKMKVYKT